MTEQKPSVGRVDALQRRGAHIAEVPGGHSDVGFWILMKLRRNRLTGAHLVESAGRNNR